MLGYAQKHTASAFLAKWQSEKWLSRLLTVFFIGTSALVALEPIRSKAPWMTFEEDDFFYYLKVAQNLAHGHGSTYNGLVPTNGYHPLWFLVLTGLSAITSNPKYILIFVVTLAFCATLATYLLARQLIASTGIGDLASTALAIYIAVYSSHIYFGGMEVLLTVPLVLSIALVIQRTDFWLKGTLHSALFGFLVSAMILSRLDTAILVAMLGAGCLAQGSIRSQLRPKNIYGLALGFLPLLFYFVLNHTFFGVWMPVSGMAKQLKFNHLPAVRPWKSAVDKPLDQLLNYLPIVLVLALFPFIYKRFTEMQRTVYGALLVFPFVFIFVLSCMSDWPLNGWYYYSFRTALCIAFVSLCSWPPTARLLKSPLFMAPLVAVVIFSVLRTHRDTSGKDYIYASAVDIDRFSKSHPGIYAMGDYAGKVGYVLNYPLVQTEGLMMDKDFLSYIRQQRPLTEVLAHYDVRYYVIDTVPQEGCYRADEPVDAGTNSPHMRDIFCKSPIATFNYPHHRVYIFDLQAR